MIEQIKQLRVEIDGLTQLCEALNPIVIYEVGVVPARRFGPDYTEIGFTERKGNSEEIKEAIKSLKLSKAWLGKVLGNLGNENPYGSGYKTVEDIIPETDKVTYVPLTIQEAIDYNKMSNIERVDWLRTEIKSLIQKLRQSNTKGYYDRALWKAEEYLCEARFWLGFEMGRIKDESK